MRTVHLLMPCLPRRCDALVGEVVRAPPTVAVVRLLDEMSDTVSALHSCRGCSSYLRRLSRGRIAAIAANAANAVSHPCPCPPASPPSPLVLLLLLLLACLPACLQLCQVLDAAEFCRNVHADAEWRREAEQVRRGMRREELP